MEGRRVMLTPIAPNLGHLSLTAVSSIKFALLISSLRAWGEGCVSAVRMPRAPALETALARDARPTHCMPP